MKLLRPKEVAERIGASRQSVWRWSKEDPTFPRPVRMGKNATAFIQEEIDEWIISKQEAQADEMQLEVHE
jgi:prophage regulatory protein